jgi:MOSC domain-containing protein YiiM
VPIETCDECRFDAADYNRSDLLGTLRAIAPMWRETVERVDAEFLARSPSPGVWSALEYASHSRDIVGAMGYLLHLTLTQDHPILDPPPEQTPEPVTPGSIDEAIDALAANAARVSKKCGSMTDADWSRLVTIGDGTVDAQWIVAHAVHDAVHHLRDAGRGLHSLGTGAPTQRGVVRQINSSDGGVPKRAIESATIGRRGVIGDRQADRKYHGRPLQALSLWSHDVIDRLLADGHPIHAGAAGENLTIAGVDWTTIRPGVRLRIGEVLVEISAYATPCAKNAQWFSDRDFKRIDHSVNPGLSRAYAWVLEGGTVVAGDEVVVEPG